MVSIMNKVADMYIQAENVIETSMDNFNAILHPLPVILNIGAIEKDPYNFSHYMHGITPIVSENMHKMDLERMSIGKALSLNLISLIDQLKMYYGDNETKNVYEYVNSDESPYKDIMGHSVTTRYLTEDVPYVVVPAMLLGKKLGLDTTVLELSVKLASLLHNTDYVKNGYNLEKLGIAQLTGEELLEYMSNNKDLIKPA